MKRHKRRSTLPKKQTMRLHVKCPNCQSPTIAYKVVQLNAILTEITRECTNENCMCRFISYDEADRILQMPLVIVNPALHMMKLSPLARTAHMNETLALMETFTNDADLEMIDEEMPQQDMFWSAHRQKDG